ncbi:hypothetical protein [cf. Phormidesmis sp. LEGE 11477]|uniref:hypothetical protein n=1 Tax=cf. Phormidesmis sp. LEGE 11477 TaxID=1828680 RepID=UPI001880F286|nr:hypothetical protein [cf. Phormidesmis sp. LEGE 11477]MBE9062997.1 hypothetical protein [cf. Phormidesmis sp. LEGE 11477]
MVRISLLIDVQSKVAIATYSFPHFAYYTTKGYTPCHTTQSAIAAVGRSRRRTALGNAHQDRERLPRQSA